MGTLTAVDCGDIETGDGGTAGDADNVTLQEVPLGDGVARSQVSSRLG